LWTYGTRRWSRIGSLCQLLREPQGFPAHGLSLHCSRACATETRSAHPRSLLQDRRAWSHLLRAVPILLSHHWTSTYSRVVCCLVRAHACGNKPSWPPVEYSRSHSRTRRFNSAWTSGSCNSAALPTCCDAIRAGLPPPSVFALLVEPAPRCSCTDRLAAVQLLLPSLPCHTRPLCLREGHGLLAPGHLHVLNEQFAVPPDLVRCLPLNGLRRPPRAAPLLPCGSARSRRIAAPPHRARLPCTLTQSQPELAQRGNRHTLHAVVPSSAPALPVPHPHTHACTSSPCTPLPCTPSPGPACRSRASPAPARPASSRAPRSSARSLLRRLEPRRAVWRRGKGKR
jgi:hypothetical protein